MISTAAVMFVMFGALADAPAPPQVRSAASGKWSEPRTWDLGRIPRPGDKVQVRAGHTVEFDAKVVQPIRSVHVAGTLTFKTDADTVLTVGLIKIQAGDDPSESGFDCEGHRMDGPAGHDEVRPALLVGTQGRPVEAGHTALIRLAAVAGLDPEECPAVVCCGGRMEFHGAAMNRTWVKLGGTAKVGDSAVALAENVKGWRVGDRVIVTATRKQSVKDAGVVPSVRDKAQTEERVVKAIEGDGTRIVLDAPLAFGHAGEGGSRGEVANLSRNVVVESADPGKARGHTMYHRNSAGSISYAEFRGLGKPGKLGKYSLHFHRCGDTMRGTSVVGASIWDGGNRWVTVHGTNRLVVKDCVGYRTLGHGFFLEDGTEVDNVFDGNLAVQACSGGPLPGQVMGFDRNDGAGFWWANSRNAFLRNVAVECDEYGFRYDAQAASGFDPVLSVAGADGTPHKVDIRTLPFLRFEGNEAHTQRRYGVNLGGAAGDKADGGVDGVGPDSRHPFAVKTLRVWDSHWAFTPIAPGVLVDGLAIDACDFGLWRPRYDRHAYRGVTFSKTRWPTYLEHGDRPEPSAFPAPLDPIDDRPPVSVITRVDAGTPGRVVVRGVSVDDGRIVGVRVNGREAKALVPDFSAWEATLDVEGGTRGRLALTAVAVDEAGNREADPHRASVDVPARD